MRRICKRGRGGNPEAGTEDNIHLILAVHGDDGDGSIVDSLRTKREKKERKEKKERRSHELHIMNAPRATVSLFLPFDRGLLLNHPPYLDGVPISYLP